MSTKAPGAESAASHDSKASLSSKSAGESVIYCASCGEEMLSSLRFCAKCGDQLWNPCLECNEKIPVDAKFCGSCGVASHDSVEGALKELADAVLEADRLAESGRYLDGLEKLTALELTDHSQLRELTDQAKERIKRFPEERKQAIELSETVLGEVKPLLTDQRFEAAHQQLARVPEAFRNREVSDLLADVETKLAESKRLRAAVKQAMADRDYDELSSLVPRLLELEPRDEKLQKLQDQLNARHAKQQQQDSTRLLKAAKTAIARCDYSRAKLAIKELPPSCKEDAELSTLVAALAERIWLSDQLRSTPAVTPALQVVSERLLKLQPHDQQHAKIDQQLKARLAKAKKEKNGRAVPWAKAPEATPLGVPVSLLDVPAQVAGLKNSTLTSGHSMLVAYGLALQGVGQAEAVIDLAPTEKKSGWLKKLSRGSKKTATSAWGIDVGSKALKAVQVRLDEQSQKVDVVQSVVIRHQKDAGAADVSPTSISKSVQQFLQQHPLEDEVVGLSIDGTQTLGRFFDLPAPKPEKFFEAVAYEVRARIPLEEERVSYGYHWSELPLGDDSATPQRRVVLVAAERQIVQQQIGDFSEVGTAQLFVQSDCVALCNAIRHSQQLAAEESIAIVEVGARSSNFLSMSASTFWFRGLFQGTDNFDKAISQGLKKTTAEAEATRLQPAKVKALHQLDDLLQPEFENLAEEFRRTIRRYKDETGNSVSKLYLCGAGSHQLGLLSYLNASQ